MSIETMHRDSSAVDVKKCARCGADHPGLVFKRLSKPIAPEGAGRIWTRWAPCPKTGEPIMLSYEG